MSKGKLEGFKTATRNSNRHTQRGLRALEQSIREDGYVAPITVAADGEALDGSARLETVADVMDGAEPIVIHHDGTRPIIAVRDDIPNADTEIAKRIAVRANRIGQIDLSWDVPTLLTMPEAVLGELWEPAELEQLGDEWAGAQKEPKEAPEPQIDKAAELQAKWGTAAGQLWQLGEHGLLCGDSTNAADVARVMGGERAALVVTDPPYNVGIVGGTHDPRDTKNYGMGPRIENDSMTDAEFDAFLGRALVAMDSVMAPGAAFYLCAPAGRTETQFRNAIDRVFTLRQCIVWAKQQAVFGRQDYHWQHESILYGWKDGAGHYFCDDHTQTTVWHIDRPMRSEKEHPTQKPVELFEKATGNSSRVGDVVFEPFCGTGTAICACERLGRKCRAIEISPAYVAVALQRWADMTGKTPTLVTGE